MNVDIKVIYRDVSYKELKNWCLKLMFIFEILMFSITTDEKKYLNCVTGFYIIHVAEYIRKESKGINWPNHVTSSATSRNDAVKLTTDLNQL